MYSTQDLATFVAVTDGGSVRQAAVDLARTQPAITQTLHRLEEAVGFPLIDRSSYRATLTPQGMLFLQRARVAVQKNRELKAYARVLSGGNETHLKLSIHGALAPRHWLHLVEHLPQSFPNTQVEIYSDEGNTPLDKLVNGEVDIAVAAGPASDAYVMDIHRLPLGEIKFVFAMAPGRRSATVEESLETLPQILVTDAKHQSSDFGLNEGTPRWCANDQKTRVALIAAGLGWGAVPQWMASDALANGELKSFRYRGITANPRHTYYLCRWHQTPLGPVADSVWQRAGHSRAAGSKP